MTTPVHVTAGSHHFALPQEFTESPLQVLVMFFSNDLLARRESGFGLLWYIALRVYPNWI